MHTTMTQQHETFRLFSLGPNNYFLNSPSDPETAALLDEDELEDPEIPDISKPVPANLANISFVLLEGALLFGSE